MVVDWTLSIGNILTGVGFIAAALTFFMSMRSDLRGVTARLSSVEESVRTLTNILTKISAQQERLDAHSLRIDRIEQQIDNAVFKQGG